MNWLLVPAGVILLCSIGVLLIPKTTSATQTIRFEADIDDVWEIYTTPDKQKHWRADVGEVVMSEDGQSWSETLEASGMTINFRIVEKNRPETFILETGSPGSFEGQARVRTKATKANEVFSSGLSASFVPVPVSQTDNSTRLCRPKDRFRGRHGLLLPALLRQRRHRSAPNGLP